MTAGPPRMLSTGTEAAAPPSVRPATPKAAGSSRAGADLTPLTAGGRSRPLQLVGHGRGADIEPAQSEPPALVAPSLSAREVEVLIEWFRSDSKSDAAARLFISLGTLNTHLARVRTKYARVGRTAPTKAALVVRALQDGLVALDDW
ncbi:MAG: LuxR C-terminal-related transcriptional regulator [Tomitella sp.]|nr:LuxR C-terminal-related transcriptional regulator [Tomitella sp.]